MKKLHLVVIALLISTTGLFSQYVKIKVANVETSDPAMKQQMEGMFKTMKMEIYNTPEQSVTTMNMMNGMVNTKTFVNTKDQTYVLYTDMMGNKIKVEPTAEELKKQKMDNEANGKNITVTEVPNDTKTILGHVCKKYLLKSDKMEMTVYAAPDVKISPKGIQGFENYSIDGFPLEYTVNAAGNKITFETEKLETTFDQSAMDIPKGNYKSMNFTDFMKQAGGMMGQ
ncbi:MAG TPA: hypothetical protein PK076_00905 [Saprospiraceae bacterium]|nr:hypothetical protein [Saprospiraceae bacterium]HQW54649.1 hypothetical protein [Saprospiraceae bacterium]